MAPRYVSKGLRGNWSDANMKSAISAVRSGKMKVYSASKRYLAEERDTKSKLGRKQLLSYRQEKELASRIIRLSDVGYPLTPRVLRTCVKKYCISNNVRSVTEAIMVGRDWLRGFLNRFKNIRKRKAQNLNPARAQKLNKAVVSDYFSKLKKTMEDNNLFNKKERIYNIDEKGCQLKLHKTPTVLAQCGAKRVHLVAPEHAENVTVVSCGNALGQAVPPMLLFKGKRMKSEWLDSLPAGSVGQMTPKGSMTAEAFVNWIHHFAKFKLPGRCLLIFDGAKCHLDTTIVDAADMFEISLFCLPSNTTHELQPMDKSVFRSFEYFWDEEVLKYWALHQDRRITKQRFGTIFSKVWDKALTPANIKAGFEATGIYPFDPTKIPEEAYAPSIPTHRAYPHVSDERVEEDSMPTQPNANISSDESDDNVVPPDLNTINDDTAIFDSDDDIPLACLRLSSPQLVLRSTNENENAYNINESSSSFHDILPTPEKISSPNSASRRKAINSLALELTKKTFENSPKASKTHVGTNEKTNNKKVTKKNKGKGKSSTTKSSESWYCFICNEDRVANMRLCCKCATYVHEECVGLTREDKENFICVKCD